MYFGLLSLKDVIKLTASYQISVDLVKWFQREKIKFEKITDDGRKSSLGLGQGELNNVF
jgi:hypothetical protein